MTRTPVRQMRNMRAAGPVAHAASSALRWAAAIALSSSVFVAPAALAAPDDRDNWLFGVSIEAGLLGHTELDPQQARSLLFNTQASLSAQQITYTQLRNNLALLLGRKPGEVNEMLGMPADVPTPLVAAALGMPQELIRRFYNNYWAKGQAKIDALRNAQLDIMRDLSLTNDVRPDNDKTQHKDPRHWAPFVLSGDWR